jgi:hypothetical protein
MCQCGRLTRRKCLKFVIGKKSALGDKPAVKKVEMNPALDTRRLAYVRGVGNAEEFGRQRGVVGGFVLV